MVPWNWEEHNGRKTRIAWDIARAQAKFDSIKAGYIAKHRALDVAKARLLDLHSYIKDDPGGELVSPCQAGTAGEYVVDPVASRICHGGNIVMHETTAEWRKFCTEPHDPLEFEFDSIAAAIGPAPARDGLEMSNMTGKPTATAPPGLHPEPERRGPGRPRKTERLEVGGI